MTIDETIAHVLKLSESATAGPWEPKPSTLSIGRTIQGSAHGPLVDSREKARADAALISDYRTICPKMAQALRTAVAALSTTAETWPTEDFGILFVSLQARACLALAEIQKEFES